MSANTDARTRQVPTLDKFHSGVPLSLEAQARRMKNDLGKIDTTPAFEPHTLVLPPGVSADKFHAAISDLKSTIGIDNVELVDKELKNGWYIDHPNTHDMYSIFDSHDTVASAVAYPGSTEEVSKVILWANKHEIPIYPISMGRNFGYGGAAPRVRGSVVVDLGKRMKKILKIDVERQSCLVEPGVSYFALYEALQAVDKNLMADCPSVGGGSLIGNACDRGNGVTPLGDHFATHCGMEIVLPNGEIIRTGMGAMPGPNSEYNDTWQSFPYGYGPYTDGMFTQSNYGIVTKMGFFLTQKMECTTCFITIDRKEDHAEVVETMQQLTNEGRLGGRIHVGPAVDDLVNHGYKRSDVYTGEGPIPYDILRAWLDNNSPFGAHDLLVRASSYGSVETVQSNIKIVRERLEKFPNSKLFTKEDLPKDHYINHWEKCFSGIPQVQTMQMMNWLPNCGHIWFSPILPPGKEHSQRLFKFVTETNRKYGFEGTLSFDIGLRESHCINLLLYNTRDPKQTKAVFDCMREMIEQGRKYGYGEYRTHLLFADQVARSYSWNNNSQLRFHELLKDALDPKGILAPGGNGIWPAKYRDGKWKILYEDGNPEQSWPKI